jgi:hypothetical protein
VCAANHPRCHHQEVHTVTLVVLLCKKEKENENASHVILRNAYPIIDDTRKKDTVVPRKEVTKEEEFFLLFLFLSD